MKTQLNFLKITKPKLIKPARRNGIDDLRPQAHLQESCSSLAPHAHIFFTPMPDAGAKPRD
jgi:hypothetical protein